MLLFLLLFLLFLVDVGVGAVVRLADVVGRRVVGAAGLAVVGRQVVVVRVAAVVARLVVVVVRLVVVLAIVFILLLLRVAFYLKVLGQSFGTEANTTIYFLFDCPRTA